MKNWGKLKKNFFNTVDLWGWRCQQPCHTYQTTEIGHQCWYLEEAKYGVRLKIRKKNWIENREKREKGFAYGKWCWERGESRYWRCLEDPTYRSETWLISQNWIWYTEKVRESVDESSENAFW